MDLGLQNKSVVVTGAANGIGTAIVLGLLEEGACPIGIDIESLQDSELERILSNLPNLRKAVTFHQCDAADEERMRLVFTGIRDLYGLVNDAGILGSDSSHGGRTLPALDTMMHAHAQAAFVATELSYPKMRQGGAIVNLGSIELEMAAPDIVLYTAAKGALAGMTVSYATALASRQIRVNMVSPGNVNTQRNRSQYAAARHIIASFEARTPLGRSVEPQEVADAVVYLLSPRSGMITGQNLVVDGGYTRALWNPDWTAQAR